MIPTGNKVGESLVFEEKPKKPRSNTLFIQKRTTQKFMTAVLEMRPVTIKLWMKWLSTQQ